jgi:hypothetical protein
MKMTLKSVLQHFILSAWVVLPIASVMGDEWGGRLIVQDGHIDLSASYNTQTNQWTTQSDRGEFDDPGLLSGFDDILLVVTDVGLDEVRPDDEGTFWGDLGEVGMPFWSIPVMSANGLIHLGFNAYGVAQGVMAASTYPSLGGEDNFTSGRVDFVLRDYQGPGTFASYRAGQNDAVQVYMDSREIGEASFDNLVPEAAGGHSHLNTVFVGRGLHAVTIRNEGVLSSTGQTVAGPDEVVAFLVSPQGRHWWLLKHFDFETAVQLQSDLTQPLVPGSIPLVISYAFGLDPLEPAASGLPQANTVERQGASRLALEMRKPVGSVDRDDRMDLQYLIEWSDDLETWQPAESLLWESLPADNDGTPRQQAIINDFSLEDKSRAFARVRVVTVDS